jgi:hypothetical protein
MDLPDPATSNHPHLVADWLELAAASDANGRVSSEALVNGREELENRRGRETSPRKLDRWNAEADVVWGLLRDRAAVYGSGYPFEVASDALELQTVALDESRLVYSFLLAAASLSAFATTDRDLLTGGFERASRHALEALLPQGSVVSVFGTTSSAGERYAQTRLIDRLEKLAEDLVTELSLEGKGYAANAKPRISGDGGLDLVGWPELVGPRKRLPIYFGQCACGDDWHLKPYEVAAITWDHRLAPVSPIVPVTLIPYAYRGEDNSWLDLFHVIPTVLIDRPRWLRLVETTGRVPAVMQDVPRDWLIEELPGLNAVQ